MVIFVMIVLRKYLKGKGYSAMVSKNSKFLFLKDFSGHLLMLMPELPLFPLHKELSHTSILLNKMASANSSEQHGGPIRHVISRLFFTPPMKEAIVSKLFLGHGSVLAPDGESPNNGSVTAWQKNASSDVLRF